MSGSPGLAARLRYVYGGRLPAHRDWVRHDLTDAGWVVRLLIRVLLQLLPFEVALVAVGLVFLPPFETVLLVLLPPIAMLVTIGAASEQVRERRLRQHGLPVPDDPDARFRDQRRY